MAIGVLDDEESGVGAGGVNILYGSSSGPDAPSLTTLHFDQDTTNVPNTAEPGDAFGKSLAWGDFDADGYDDLLIGVPYEDITLSLTNAGLVNVLYGGLGGLSGTGSQSFSGGFGSIPYDAAASDVFGEVVAAGDFDGDQYDDVAIAATGYDDGATSNVGAVVILYGSASGLSNTGQQVFHQGTVGMAGDGNQAQDMWGSALVTGDFDCDGYEDLAVGAHLEGIAGVSGAYHGAVTVIYGSASGLDEAGSQWWHQNVTDIDDEAEASDRFGIALAAANFNGDTDDSRDCVDLAIGAEHETVSGNSLNGAVNIIYGTTSGLSATDDQFLYQGNGLAGSLAANGEIGELLTVGRFNYGTYDDLAVGAAQADPGGNSSAGEVYLVKGSASGLTSLGGVRWDSSTAGVPGTREASDGVGRGLSYAESEGDGNNHYLFLGAYNEDGSQGAVSSIELDSSMANFAALGGSFEWKQDDIEGTPENNENFGYSMPAPRLKARAIN
jgi:disulfide bond formation protein DsbB